MEMTLYKVSKHDNSSGYKARRLHHNVEHSERWIPNLTDSKIKRSLFITIHMTHYNTMDIDGDNGPIKFH